MTTNTLNLFCLVDGEATANAFSVKIAPNDTVDDLKVLICARLEIDTLSKDLTVWRVLLPISDDDDDTPILLNHVTSDKKKLGPATRLSKVFPEELPEEVVHIIVQRPTPTGEPCALQTYRVLSPETPTPLAAAT